MTPKVSILIPVYNTAHLLDRCLQSVVSQTLSQIEIICVDDGSTDDSYQVLCRWARRDARIKVLTQPNGRQGKARNKALQIATGEYVGMIDSDDYIPVQYFEQLYLAALRNDADIAVCGIVKEKPALTRTILEFDQEVVTSDVQEKLSVCQCPPHFHPVNKLYRREFLLRMGLWFAEGVCYEDVMFVIRALCESNRLVTVPHLSYCYVLNAQSTVKSHQTLQKQLQKYAAHKSMVHYVTQHGIEIPMRYRHITVRQTMLLGLCLWKIKECDNKRTLRLFDLIPLWHWKV